MMSTVPKGSLTTLLLLGKFKRFVDLRSGSIQALSQLMV